MYAASSKRLLKEVQDALVASGANQLRQEIKGKNKRDKRDAYPETNLGDRQ
jgi:hypothetical protein